MSIWFHKFNIVGGIPRSIFSEDSVEDLLIDVDTSISNDLDILKSNVDQISNYNQNSMQQVRAPHILFHFFSLAPHTLPSLIYASRIVDLKVNAKYHILEASRCKTLMMTSNPDLQSWRGKQIENFMLSRLVTCDIRLRLLNSSSRLDAHKRLKIDAAPITRLGEQQAKDCIKLQSSTFSHMPYHSAIIQSVSEISITQESSIYHPVSKNFPAIDALIVDNDSRTIFYIQCTVSMVHPINYNQMKALYASLSKFRNYRHKFIFLVSKDIHTEFVYQPYKSQKKLSKARIEDLDIDQYVGIIEDQ